MTLIFVREATRQQTKAPKIAEKEKKLQIKEDSGDGSRFVFIFFLVILFC
jgi:hypothetical protein